MHDLRKKQLGESDISPVLKWLESESGPIGPEVAAFTQATQNYWLYLKSLKITDGVLFQEFYRKDGTREHLQLIVPRKLKDEIMYQMHECLLSGHLGKGKTRE